MLASILQVNRTLIAIYKILHCELFVSILHMLIIVIFQVLDTRTHTLYLCVSVYQMTIWLRAAIFKFETESYCICLKHIA